jgi:hypothetical protein
LAWGQPTGKREVDRKGSMCLLSGEGKTEGDCHQSPDKMIIFLHENTTP